MMTTALLLSLVLGQAVSPVKVVDPSSPSSAVTTSTAPGNKRGLDVNIVGGGGGNGLTDAQLRATPVPVTGGLPVVTTAGILNNDGDNLVITLSGHTVVAAAVSDATACSLGAEFLRADGSWSSAALYDARNWTSLPGDFSGGGTRALMVIPPGATQARVICNGAGTGVAPYGVTVSLTATGASGPAPYVQTGGTPSPTVNPNVHVAVGGLDAGGVPQVLQMDAVGRLRTLSTPNHKIAINPVASAISVTDSATALPLVPLTDRMSLCIYNNGSATVFVGDGTVTPATGFPVPAGGAFCDDAGAQPYYGVVATGTADVRVLEN